MGQSVSWLSGLLWAKKQIRILILGLVRDRLPPPPEPLVTSNYRSQKALLTDTSVPGQRRQDHVTIQTKGSTRPTSQVHRMRTRRLTKPPRQIKKIITTVPAVGGGGGAGAGGGRGGGGGGRGGRAAGRPGGR